MSEKKKENSKESSPKSQVKKVFQGWDNESAVSNAVNRSSKIKATPECESGIKSYHFFRWEK